MPYSYHLIVYQEIVCVCVFFFISSFRFANVFQSSISALQHGQSSITLLRFNLCYIVSRITLELNKRATIKSNARKIAEKLNAEAAYSYAVNWKAINKYLNLIKLHGKLERKKCTHTMEWCTAYCNFYRFIGKSCHFSCSTNVMHTHKIYIIQQWALHFRSYAAHVLMKIIGSMKAWCNNNKHTNFMHTNGFCAHCEFFYPRSCSYTRASPPK